MIMIRMMALAPCMNMMHGTTSPESVSYTHLFSLNVDTGESQILYDTKNNQTRIVGYEDGILYLFQNDYKVYSQPLSDGEATELLSIPKSNDVTFDWYGDYMFVIYRDTNTELRYRCV